MKGLLIALLVTATHSLPLATVSNHSSNGPKNNSNAWMLSGDVADACALATLGAVTDTQGAQLSVSCSNDVAVAGNLLFKMSATELHYRRITLTAEVQQATDLSSVLWIKSVRDTHTLLFDNDADHNFLNTEVTGNGWVPRSISLAVDADATSVSFGMLLQGGGTVRIRNVHLDVSRAGPVSTAAQQVLDEAVAIIKQHTAPRNDVDWRLLDAEAQQFAAGAQHTADVYPVIRHLLLQLGDKRSLLLTPETSHQLDQHHVGSTTSAASGVNIYVLPDGANLVLAASARTIETRIAERWP